MNALDITIEGTKELEDGIIVNMNYFNSVGDSIWNHTWEKIDVTELATVSEAVFWEGLVYIVVDGTLYALSRHDGTELWQVPELGSVFAPPVVDSNGNIYVAGQYEPYLSAVTEEGSLMWQITNDDQLAYTHRVWLTEAGPAVEFPGGTAVFSWSGKPLDRTF